MGCSDLTKVNVWIIYCICVASSQTVCKKGIVHWFIAWSSRQDVIFMRCRTTRVHLFSLSFITLCDLMIPLVICLGWTCTCCCRGFWLSMAAGLSALSTDDWLWSRSTEIMLTAFQIGLSCCSQLFLFLSEPEFRPSLLSATPERERDGRIRRDVKNIFALLKLLDSV